MWRQIAVAGKEAFVKAANPWYIVALLGFAGFFNQCGGTSTHPPVNDMSVWEFQNYDQTDTATDDQDAAGETVGTPDGDSIEKPDVPVVSHTSKLDFVMTHGDDQVPCAGSDTGQCTVILTSIGYRDLEVVYTEDDQPKGGKTIRYQIGEGGGFPLPDSDQARLEAASSPTNGHGIGKMRLFVDSATHPYQFSVQAWAPSSPEAGTLLFNVVIDPKDQPPLRVSFHYAGARQIDEIQVRLFRQDEGAAGVMCPELDLAHLPTADVAAPASNLLQTVVFNNDAFIDLQNDSPQVFTILAVGSRGDTARIRGCNDADGVVRYSYTNEVIIELSDIPPKLVGSYDVRSEFDLVSALPDNVEIVVNTLIGFFNNPAGQLALLICQLGGASGALQDLCGYVFTDPANPDLGSLTVIGDIVTQILNALLEGILENNGLGDVLHIGQDVGDILKHLTFTSIIQIDAEPDPLTGILAEQNCHDDWQCVRYRWTYGVEGCPNPQQPDCGMNQFCFSAIGMDVVTADFSASVNLAQTADGLPPYSQLTIDPHGLNIKYGMLMNYLIQKELLPLIAGDGSDGGPVIDSYEKFIKSLLAGKECLYLDTCCADFAASVLEQAGDVISESLVASACEALVQYGSAYLENLLLSLDANTDETFIIGTPSGDPCRIYDDNDDLVVDTLGKETAPCHWDTTIMLFNQEVHVNATFVGERD